MVQRYDISDGALEGVFVRASDYDSLAAENARLKEAITTHSQSTHFCELCGKDDPCSNDDVCYVLNETPATDAAIAYTQAQGVDKFIESFQKITNSDSLGKTRRRIAARLIAHAVKFSGDLRGLL